MLSRMVLSGLLVSLTLNAAAFAGKPPETAKRSQRYAILIGINDYSPPLGKLEYCQNDMTELRAHLVAAGFDSENITVMSEQAATARLRPSKSNIEGELRLRLQLANEDDIVFVAFSGHGLQLEGKSYLCPCDAKLDSAGSLIAIDDLYAQLETCQASQKVLVVDACRNEPIVRGFRAGALADKLSMQVQAPPKGLIVLSSCEAGQFSAEDAKLKHGVFMNYIMQGLKGAADTAANGGNSNGRISLDELYFYAHEKTKRHVAESHGIVQRPVLKGEIIGRFDIAMVPDSSKLLDLSRRESRPEPIADSNPTRDMDSLRSRGFDNPLLKQADAYLKAGQHEKAIRACTAIIDNSALDNDVRLEARKSRGAAYLKRGNEADIDNALIDHRAAELQGVHLTIRAASVNLQNRNKPGVQINQNQAVLVTRNDDGWLWVAAVDGNDRLQGYIRPAAVIAQPVQVVQTQQVEAQSNQTRPRSHWATPQWETPRQLREGRRNGTLR